MSNAPSKSTTKGESESSEISLRHYYGGNIYEIFMRGIVLTHAQIYYPSPATTPSQASFHDFPQDVQKHFATVIRARRP